MNTGLLVQQRCSCNGYQGTAVAHAVELGIMRLQQYSYIPGTWHNDPIKTEIRDQRSNLLGLDVEMLPHKVTYRSKPCTAVARVRYMHLVSSRLRLGSQPQQYCYDMVLGTSALILASVAIEMREG